MIHSNTLGQCPSCRAVHGWGGSPHIYIGMIKSRMFSFTHHLKINSLDAVIMCVKCTYWKLQGTLLKPSSLLVLLTELLTHSFYTIHGRNPRVSPWHLDYIMPFPGEAPPTCNELSNQQPFPPRHTHVHAYELQNIRPIPHSSSSFWWGNILHMLVTLYSWIHFTSVFFISVLMVSCIISLAPHI